MKYNQSVFGDNWTKDGWLRASLEQAPVMFMGNREYGVCYSPEVTGIFKNPMPTMLKFYSRNVIITNDLILFALYNCSLRLPKWEYKLREYIYTYTISSPFSFFLFFF